MFLRRRRRRGGTRFALALIAAACALAAVIAVAAAEDETEATTFGADGIASQSLGIHFEETRFSSVEARSDGGLVAQRDDQVASYLANGTPDPSVPPQHVSKYRRVFPVADGKSLVLDDSTLTRVNSDGSVDTSFGGGTVKVAWNASAAAELPSGKILVVGTGWGGTHQTFAWVNVQLVNPDGSIDQAVGRDGTLALSIPYYNEPASELEIAPAGDGGALVAGDRFLLEVRADGSPNPAFGGDGLVDGLPPLTSGRVLSDGSVAAVGTWVGSGGKDLLVLRYTPAGTPDSGFGADGIRRFDLGGEEEVHAASWAADGSVIVGGSAQPAGSCFEAEGCEEVPILAAFDPGGGLDPGFGNGGVLRLAALAGPSEDLYGSGVEALTRRPDDSIVAAGSSAPERTTAFLAAVSPQGMLLPGFGDGGIVRVRQPVPATQTVIGFVPLAGGKLLAAGTTDVGIEDAAVLIRYAANGSLDRSFGGGAGYVVVDEARFARGFALDSGKVLISTFGYPRSKLLELRAADGAREPSFGSDGGILLPKRVRVEGVAFAADSGAIVVGTRDDAGPLEPGVVLRYRPNGKADRGFGRNGRIELQTPGGREVRARALAVGSGGGILVGGVSRSRFAVTRLLPDGRPDPRFGSGGWALTSAGGTTRSVALVRRGSHIYLAGVVGDDRRRRVVLLRFNENGRLDPSFGRNGRRTATISEPAEPKAIVPSRTGVFVVLSRGPKPLLLFRRGGKVRPQSLAPHQQFLSNARATVSRGSLILGWNAFSPAIRRDVYYLARRPLGGR
ncbi:MAG TPA: delta-60 repeat domain-containing protein [Solirubrobacterales bacterium]